MDRRSSPSLGAQGRPAERRGAHARPQGRATVSRLDSDRIADNTPLDEFARSIISARGSTYTNPAANYFRAIRKPQELAEATAQVFLGDGCNARSTITVRSLDAETTTMGQCVRENRLQAAENIRRDRLDKHEFNSADRLHEIERQRENPKTGKAAPARFLSAGQPVPGGDDPLREMAKG